MQAPVVSYLYTLATLAVTFVGFSALVIILRQTLGGEMSKLDILITRIFIQLGFMVAAGAMLPPLIGQFSASEAMIWRGSSAPVAFPSILFACTYPSRRQAASGVRTPVAVWIDVVLILSFSLVLVCEALGVLGGSGSGPYAAALSGILGVSAWAYLQALNTLLRHHHKHLVSAEPHTASERRSTAK